ncbi:hypothetical protein BH23VER1_BH23VER1_00310 [soil metagenome]
MSPAPHRNPLIAVGFVFAALLLAVGIAALTLLVRERPQQPLHSPPTQERPRHAAEFDALCAPVPDPRSPLDPAFLPTLFPIEIEGDPGDPNLTVVTAKLHPPEESYVLSPELVALGSDLAFVLPGGASGTVEWIAAKTPAESDLEADGRRYPLDLYTPDLIPLPPDSPAYPDRWSRQVTGNPNHPRTGFSFRLVTEGFENVLWRIRGIYDSNTNYPLTSGHSYTSSGPSCNVKSELKCVHPVEVRAIMDLFHGPVETLDIPATPGAEATLPGILHLRLVYLVPGESRGTSSSGGHRPGDPSRLAVSPTKDAAGTHSTILYSLSPASLGAATTLEAVDRNGAPHRATGAVGSLETLRTTGFELPVSEIAGFRLTYRPDVLRLIIDFPPLPGTPPENAAVTDLFDVVIPYLVVDSDYAFRDAIASAVQLDQINHTHSHSPPLGYSRAYRDHTVRQLADLYLASQPGSIMVVDLPSGELRFEPSSPPVPLTQRLKDLLQRRFSPP